MILTSFFCLGQNDIPKSKVYMSSRPVRNILGISVLTAL